MTKYAQHIKIALYVLLSAGLLYTGVQFVRELGRAQETSDAERKRSEAGTATPKGNSFAVIGKIIAFVACASGLGLLIARDFSAQIGHKVGDLVFNEDLKGVYTPEYERAEMEATAGHFLEAIRLMRIHYAAHPNEVYVPIRIAEIYEKNLHNPVAASLEYEEILKLPLPPERWGWTAIHLANLLSGKLNRPDDAVALLERIVSDCGKTAAAKKARARLGLPEEIVQAPPQADVVEQEIEVDEVAADAEPEDSSHLPSGFRARSRGPSDAARPASDMMDYVRGDSPEDAPPSNLPPGFRPRN